MLTRPILITYLAAFSALHAAPVEVLPPDLRGAVQPQVAVAPSERIHVAFGKDNAIYHTTSADGRSFSAPVKVGELEKLALRMRRGPRVAATDQLLLITAISHTDGNLHAWLSSDGGKIWRQSAPLNSMPKSAREGLHSIAGDGHGLVAAVWLDLRSGSTEIRARMSHDCGATWGEDTSIYQSPDGHVCECCVPNVAIGPRGEIAIMWRNWLGGARDSYAVTSGDAGHSFTSAQKLGSESWKINACPMDGGSIAFSPDGAWQATWRRKKTIFATTETAPEIFLSTYAAQPVVGFAGQTPVMLWESNGALMLQRSMDRPAIFAKSGASASLASGTKAATVVWEAGAGAESSILLDRIP